jgi:transcriptional regulator with XRE-family HTH domain
MNDPGNEPYHANLFGQELKQARADRQMSLRKLAMISGIPISTLWRIEIGVEPSLGNYKILRSWMDGQKIERKCKNGQIFLKIFIENETQFKSLHYFLEKMIGQDSGMEK